MTTERLLIEQVHASACRRAGDIINSSTYIGSYETHREDKRCRMYIRPHVMPREAMKENHAEKLGCIRDFMPSRIYSYRLHTMVFGSMFEHEPGSEGSNECVRNERSEKGVTINQRQASSRMLSRFERNKMMMAIRSTKRCKVGYESGNSNPRHYTLPCKVISSVWSAYPNKRKPEK